VTLTESMVEAAALEWFGELGYSCLGAEGLPPAHRQRESYGEAALIGRLLDSTRQLNPAVSESCTLATLRDPAPTILAKLMPGELSVAWATVSMEGSV
jgi:type I restriction enzyme, R subunit